ncbi:uncharacterized protein ACRADG_009967 [Cochliomyia hominivorax]
MRVFLLTLYVGLSFAVPRGYNYQIEVSPSGNSIQAIPNEYQIVQQQDQVIYQEQFPPLQQLTQSLTGNQQEDYQFDSNQFLQKAQQQVAHYEQLLKQAQEQEVQDVVEPQTPIEIKGFIEPPKVSHKAEVAKEPQQPQLIVQPKKTYHPQKEEKKVSFQKEFFYLSAPPEEYEPPKDLDKQLASLKKNLRVVFIKAPESNGLEKAALQLAQQSANAQTAIYVLTKQHDAADLAQKLQNIQPSKPQQPEVAFIKYRTQEEAEHAQRIIQAQYEALDGPNHINRPDTGVTHNFVGSVDVGNGVESRKSLVDNEDLDSVKPVPKYLPTADKK